MTAAQKAEDEALTAKLLRNIECESEGDFEGNPTIQHLEYKIQTRRILQIFDNLIKCCQLTFCLKEILRNEYILREAFDYCTLQDVLRFCDDVNGGGYQNMMQQGMSQQSLHFSSMFEKIMKSTLKSEIPLFIENVSRL